MPYKKVVSSADDFIGSSEPVAPTPSTISGSSAQKPVAVSNAAPQQPTDTQNGGVYFNQQGPTEEVSGILDVQPEGHGFLRPKFIPSYNDVYISQSQIRRFLLRAGDLVTGVARPPKDNERYYGLLKVEKVNEVDADKVGRRPYFDDLTAIYPKQQIILATGKQPISTRIIDLIAPIGFGQRGMVVSPPKAGKTTILKEIAAGISQNFPKAHLMAALIGERPEEVTDIASSVSDKHRISMITYTVQHGDTLSTIAQKFDISADTIKWANGLSDDTITSGDQLQIPPVSGVVHKVKQGETIYSIAKEFGANPQAIAEFPGNDFANPETLALVDGQTLVIPDGKMPTASNPVPQPQYAQTPGGDTGGGSSVPYTGGFIWPLHGLITTPFSYWHPGIDIAGPVGTPIYAIMGGTVTESSCGWNTGYGCEVIIHHPNGFWSRYAHMNGQPFVSVGQSVSGGQQIGTRGSTGNSTGPHTHFEIHASSGAAVNPLAYLP